MTEKLNTIGLWFNDGEDAEIQKIEGKPNDELKHYLIITNLEEDTGQDGYFEDLHWEIEHDPNCPKEIATWKKAGQQDEYYTCGVGSIVYDIGLDGLELETGYGDGWRELEPGRYEIEFYTEKYSSDGYGGNFEYDAGLRFVDP